jgi:hypothetical protein
MATLESEDNKFSSSSQINKYFEQRLSVSDTYAQNILSLNVSILRNIVHCTSIYSCTNGTGCSDVSKINNVTIKIDNEGNEFLREGMFYISPSFKNTNINNLSMVFEANESLPKITLDLQTKRNYWINIRDNVDYSNLLNNSNLVFKYAINDDYKKYKTYYIDKDTKINNPLIDLCNRDEYKNNQPFSETYQNPMSTNRQIFRDAARLGCVDMYISFINISNSNTRLQPDISNSRNDSKGQYLYDGNDILLSPANKLVPQFRDFEPNNPDVNYFITNNKDNFIWTIKYIGDNKFTIQNKFTGRYLKAFEYYSSTYAYVGDNSDIDFNTDIWYIQNIFPPRDSNNIVINIASQIYTRIIKILRDCIIGSGVCIVQPTVVSSFLNYKFCGESDDFIDSIKKVISNYESSFHSQESHNLQNLYTRICACNMAKEYFRSKNCSLTKLLERLGQNDCSFTKNTTTDEGRKYLDNITDTVKKLTQNWKCDSGICTDNLCGTLSDRYDSNLVESKTSTSAEGSCGNSITCIQNVSKINFGTLTNNTDLINQTQNCGPEGGSINLQSILNYNSKLIKNSTRGPELYQYLNNCYNLYNPESGQGKSCFDPSSVNCILNKTGSYGCSNGAIVGASRPTQQTGTFDPNSENTGVRTITYRVTGSDVVFSDNSNIVANKALYLSHFINDKTSGKDITIADNMSDQASYSYAKFKQGPFDANGLTLYNEITVKDPYDCGIKNFDEKEDEYDYKEQKWFRNYYYGDKDISKNTLKYPNYNYILPAHEGVYNNINTRSKEFENACKYVYGKYLRVPLDSLSVPLTKPAEVTFVAVINAPDSSLYEYFKYKVKKEYLYPLPSTGPQGNYDPMTNNFSWQKQILNDIEEKQRQVYQLDILKNSNPDAQGFVNVPVRLTNVNCQQFETTSNCKVNQITKQWERIKTIRYPNQVSRDNYSRICGVEANTIPIQCNQNTGCSVNTSPTGTIGNCNDISTLDETRIFNINSYGNINGNIDTDTCKIAIQNLGDKYTEQLVNISNNTVQSKFRCDSDCRIDNSRTIESVDHCDRFEGIQTKSTTYPVILNKGRGKDCLNLISELYNRPISNLTIDRNDSSNVSVIYKERCPDVNCNVTDWSSCSKTCGGGIRKRTILENSQGNGDSCRNYPLEEMCNTQPCPPDVQNVDCVLNDWGSYSDCSKSCGGGTKIRIRTIKTPQQGAGRPCDSLEETVSCNEQPCSSSSGSGSTGGTSGGTSGGSPSQGNCVVSSDRILGSCADGKQTIRYKINTFTTNDSCISSVNNLLSSAVERGLSKSVVTEGSDRFVQFIKSCISSGETPPAEKPPTKDNTTPSTKPLQPSPTPAKSNNTYLYLALGIVLMLVLIFAIYKLMKV